MKTVLQLLSLAAVATVMGVSVAAIIATVKAELPYIRRALGADGYALPPLNSTRAPRIRVTRQLRMTGRKSLRAAA